MSFASKIVADAKAFKNEIIKLAAQVPALAEKVAGETPEVEALVALAFPHAAPIENALSAVLSAAENVVTSAGIAASSNGLSATQDQGVIASIEAVIKAIEAAK